MHGSILYGFIFLIIVVAFALSEVSPRKNYCKGVLKNGRGMTLKLKPFRNDVAIDFNFITKYIYSYKNEIECTINVLHLSSNTNQELDPIKLTLLDSEEEISKTIQNIGIFSCVVITLKWTHNKDILIIIEAHAVKKIRQQEPSIILC